jgi:hypothetical protein
MKLFLLGALLTAAPVFSQIDPLAKGDAIDWFSLEETRTQVREVLGAPRLVAEFGSDFESWQFQIGVEDSHEFSHQVVFRVSDHTLVSVTRQWESEHNVDALFPIASTRYVRIPGTEYTVAVRKLSGRRLLLGMGVTGPGAPTTQVTMIKASDLRFFIPDLASVLE